MAAWCPGARVARCRAAVTHPTAVLPHPHAIGAKEVVGFSEADDERQGNLLSQRARLPLSAGGA